VASKGRRQAGTHCILLLADQGPAEGSGGAGEVRLGVTVSRRVGGAVVRNRVKRRLRSWFRENRGEIPSNSDLVVIARRSAAGVSYRELEQDLLRSVGRLRRPAS